MYLSTKFINKYQDEYASFGYTGTKGTYSSRGLDLDEYLEIYTSIVRLEAKKEKLEFNKRYIPYAEYIAQLGNIDIALLKIEVTYQL